jgi:hypothetical protein
METKKIDLTHQNGETCETCETCDSFESEKTVREMTDEELTFEANKIMEAVNKILKADNSLSPSKNINRRDTFFKEN